MTSTMTDADIEQLATEPPPACQAVVDGNPCPRPAEWYLRASCGTRCGLPHDGIVCTYHKDAFLSELPARKAVCIATHFPLTITEVRPV